MQNSKLFTGYALLVGAPLLVLFTAAEFGKGLTAPKAVSGKWQIAWEKPLVSRPGCLDGSSPWTITQSGGDISIVAGDVTWTGSVDSRGLTAKGGCGVLAATVNAQIFGQPAERSMTGYLRLGQEAPVGFHALRLKSGKGEGR